MQTTTTPIPPAFYTLPGNEEFAPRVSHPNEDAGADIKLYIPEAASGAVLFTEKGAYTNSFVDGEWKPQVDLRLIPHIILRPQATIVCHTGFKVILPQTPLGILPVYKIVPRSGLAIKHQITVTNSPGIIDKGYTGWVKVALTNNGNTPHIFTHGARIAQGLCEMVIDQTNNRVITDENLIPSTMRGEGGFGSTKV